MALDRRGALSTSDRAAMSLHLESCPDCRITRQLMVDFEHSGAPEPGDELIFGRAAKSVLARRSDRRTRAPRFAVAAALVLLVGGAASGAVLIRTRLMAPSIERGDLRRLPGSKAVAAPRWTVRSRSSDRPSARDSGAAVASPEPVPTEVELPGKAEEAPAPVPPSTGSSRPAERASGDDGPSRPGALWRAESAPSHLVATSRSDEAAAVFVRALKQREQGRPRQAIATFRSLQRQFPRSPEAMVSRVSLGDLLLDAGDPAAALLAFDAYLVAQPSGQLATEASLGKARALSALGHGTHHEGGTP